MAKSATDDTRINFADVEDQKEFSLLPAGRYPVEITGLQERQASDQAQNPGARILRWEFTVAQPHEYADRKVWDNHVCVKDAMWKVKAFLAALDVDTSKLSYDLENSEFELDGEILDMDDFVGRLIDVKVGVRHGRKDPNTQKEYSAQNRVNNFYPHEDSDDDLLP
jgi:hypothetical protein